MQAPTRFSGTNHRIELQVVERGCTPKWDMKLPIHLHLSGLSPSNTVAVLENFNSDRARRTVHYWVHNADLDLADDCSPTKLLSTKRW